MNAGPPRGGLPPRGRGRGGRGGAQAPRQQAQPAPLAAQMRQVLRLEEPKEMAILRRFRDLGASKVKSVYGQTGLLEQELFVPAELARSLGYSDVPDRGEYISLADAEEELSVRAQRAERERALARREVRLPEARRRVSWGSLTPEERRVLLLSQKEYNSFRASQGGAGAASAAQPETTSAQAEVSGQEVD